MLRLIQIIFILSMFLHADAQVATWEKWTKTFKSDTSYKNPYADVQLTVKFTGPGNQTFETYAYWTGGRDYAVSFSFPTPGKWTWALRSTDAKNKGFRRQKGVLEVTTYNGENPLYRNGFLRVSENGRYLTYDNHKPFLWTGCTAWNAPSNATYEEWKRYVDDRVSKHFSIVQITPYRGGGWTAKALRNSGDKNRAGEEPFFDYHSRINPAYWMDLLKKVDYANERGVVIVFVGIPGWQLYIGDPAQRKTFLEFFTAMFSGNFVIYSPASDTRFSAESDTLGMEIDRIDPRHLITQHPGTPSQQPVNIHSEAYYDRPYLDFSMCQSGHNNGRSDRCVWTAINWHLSLFKRNPHKPVINGEAFYHGSAEAEDPKYRGTDTDARRLGWYSWLSGSLGYTYGALGLWNWGLTTNGVFVDWRDAIARNSSFQMKYMNDFFQRINWWELEPYHQGIMNQEQEILKTMVMARNPSATLAVAYLPAGTAAEIDLKSFKGNIRTQWFNPRDNQYLPEETLRNDSGSHIFDPGDAEGDWVLLIRGD